MDWIKVKVSHVLYEYTDFSIYEFNAWIKIMSLTAVMEKSPTAEVLKRHINPRTLESLSKKLETHMTSVETIVKKVLEDVEYTKHLKAKNKSRMAEFRHKQANFNEFVARDVTRDVACDVQVKIREDKIREDKSKVIASAPLTFIEKLKINPTYKHINFEHEVGKMNAWLALPRNKGRKLTDRFMLNWLNKIDAPIPTQAKIRPVAAPVVDPGPRYDPGVAALVKATAMKMKG